MLTECDARASVDATVTSGRGERATWSDRVADEDEYRVEEWLLLNRINGQRTYRSWVSIGGNNDHFGVQQIDVGCWTGDASLDGCRVDGGIREAVPEHRASARISGLNRRRYRIDKGVLEGDIGGGGKRLLLYGKQMITIGSETGHIKSSSGRRRVAKKRFHSIYGRKAAKRNYQNENGMLQGFRSSEEITASSGCDK
ncbi:hypothetical protein NQ318_004030 [Aromia moschata]|uniref:Uncharacterized protein n=1 Tax=Aromia moschata TaxID=1265417 RepID=A0AAV8Z925_9CUCU|nr:hypothetical protein NQ318_004030 [Aromia moschata]